MSDSLTSLPETETLDRMTRFARGSITIFYGGLFVIMLCLTPLFWLVFQPHSWVLALISAHFVVLCSALPLFFHRWKHIATPGHAWGVLIAAGSMAALDLAILSALIAT